MTQFTLTAADLYVILQTLHESRSVTGYFTTTDEARKDIGIKVERMLHAMTAKVTVEEE